MLENFTNLMKNINLHIQEVQQIARRIKLKETHTLRCHNQTSKCQRQRENLVISKTEATHQVQAISDKIFYLTFHKQPWRQKAMGWPKALKERLSTKNSICGGNGRQIISFQGKQKLREYTASKPAGQRIIKQSFRVK